MKPIVLLLSVLLFNGCIVFCHKDRFRYADVEMVVHEGSLSALNESHFICYDFQKQVSQDGPKKASDYWTWIDLNWDWKSLCHGAAVFQEGIWKHDLAVLPITSYLPTTDKYELERTGNATRFAQALDILRGRLGPDRVIVSTSNDIYSLRKELKACARDLALDFKETFGDRPRGTVVKGMFARCYHRGSRLRTDPWAPPLRAGGSFWYTTQCFATLLGW